MGAWGMTSDLPYSRAAVEIAVIGMSVKMGTGDLNPHIFYYPHLFLYILLFFFGLFFIAGKVIGIFPTVGDFQNLFFVNATAFYIIARCVTLFFMAGSVFLTYLIAKKAFNKKIAMISAAFMTFNITNVQLSHFALPDIPVLFFSLLAFYFIVRIMDGVDWKIYFLGGFLIGLATATKYQGLFLVLSLFIAHFLSLKRKSIKDIVITRKLPLAGIGVFMGFFLGTPFCILDYRNFVTYFTRVTGSVNSLSYGFASYRVNSMLPVYIIKDLLPFAMGILMSVLCIIAILYALKKHVKADIVILGTIILFLTYVIFSSWSYLKPRHIIHLFPLLFILIARLLYDTSTMLFKRENMARSIFLGAVTFLVLIPSVGHIYAYEKGITRRPIHIEAKTWIETNIPAGSKIAMHDGIPVNPNKKSIARKLKEVQDKKIGQGTKLEVMLTNRHLFPVVYDIYELPYPWRYDFDESDFDFERHINEGVRYFVFTEELSHYAKEPQKHKLQLKYYDSVKNSCALIKRFDSEYLRSELGVTEPSYIVIYEYKKEKM